MTRCMCGIKLVISPHIRWIKKTTCKVVIKPKVAITWYFGTPPAATKSNTFLLEVVQMKKVLSTIVAALVAVSFSAVVFAADAAKPAAAPAAGADVAAPAAEKK